MQNTLLAFLEQKPKELSMTENQCLAILEKKERILAETSRLNVWSGLIRFFLYLFNLNAFFNLIMQMELKHTELQKRRLDDEFESTKTERDEMASIYFEFPKILKIR